MTTAKRTDPADAFVDGIKARLQKLSGGKEVCPHCKNKTLEVMLAAVPVNDGGVSRMVVAMTCSTCNWLVQKDADTGEILRQGR